MPKAIYIWHQSIITSRQNISPKIDFRGSPVSVKNLKFFYKQWIVSNRSQISVHQQNVSVEVLSGSHSYHRDSSSHPVQIKDFMAYYFTQQWVLLPGVLLAERKLFSFTAFYHTTITITERTCECVVKHGSHIFRRCNLQLCPSSPSSSA